MIWIFDVNNDDNHDADVGDEDEDLNYVDSFDDDDDDNFVINYYRNKDIDNDHN